MTYTHTITIEISPLKIFEKTNFYHLQAIRDNERTLICFFSILAGLFLLIVNFANFSVNYITSNNLPIRNLMAGLFIGIGILGYFSKKFYSHIQTVYLLFGLLLFCFLHYFSFLQKFVITGVFLNLGWSIVYNLFYRSEKHLNLSFLSNVLIFYGVVFFTNSPLSDSLSFLLCSATLLFATWVLFYKRVRSLQIIEEVLRYNNAIFEQSSDAKMIIDSKNKRIIKVNDAAIKLFKSHSRAELMSLTKEEFSFLKFIDLQEEAIASKLELSDSWEDEIKTQDLRNKDLILDVVINKLVEDDHLFMIRLLDISSKELAQKGFKLMQRTINQMSDGLILLDNKFSIYYINDAARESLGYEKETLANVKISAIDLHFHAIPNSFWDKINEKGKVERQSEFKTANGEIIPVGINYSYVSFEGSLLLCLIVRDISYWLKAMDLVREQNALYRTVYDRGPMAILLCDMKGQVINVNDATVALFEFTKEELLSMNILDIVYEPDRAGFYELDAEVADGIEEAIPTYSVEKRYVKKNGQLVWGAITTSNPIETTKQVYTVSLLDDITVKKTAEDELREYALKLENSNEQLKQFAYVVSHDLQEPLRMVSSYLQLLMRRSAGDLDQDSKEFIEFAVDGSQRMSLLIESLLKYSRVHTKGNDFEKADLNRLFDTAKAQMSHQLEENGAALTASDLPEMEVDKNQIVQLFQILIENSIKFKDSTRSLKIELTIERTEKGFTFSVKDNGIGMEEEYLEKIFGVFKRLHTRTEYSGTGIGLAIAKRIVERHEGKIWATSVFGKETTILFTIPF